ncbi:hypothetical protein TrLO_g8204 [Triparma laevis f. longispina]|uniref:Calmodulin n=1 Tax=Triparma laevis f. longispina TaxID=1714387 RepID=A0A9W6ZBW9_9STRA|nr:hypothetical protein TrLO_g8204 [Triparma laevis f. longispina]
MGNCLSDGASNATHDARGNLMRERKEGQSDVFDVFETVKSLGEGSMGSVSMVRRKNTDLSSLGSFKNRSSSEIGESGSKNEGGAVMMKRRSSHGSGLYALKAIHLNRMTDEFIQELKNEIDILKSLDHPNIVKPMETFNRRRQMFIIMELCSGGDLYTRDPYSEQQAAAITGKLLSAISYMHSRNITHRDLKFENIMFESSHPEAEIKVIDFGLSKKYVPEAPHLVDGVGTIYTMAPQVLQGMYTSQADLWSVGVIAYMLLCSEMPFTGRKRRHVIDKIMRCSYDFKGSRWNNISADAKEFINNLIELNPKKRFNADQALKSKWMLKDFAIANRRPSDNIMEAAATSLKKYGAYGQLQKMALMVIAHQSSTDEIMELRKAFDAYDTANNGTIQLKEFQAALRSIGNHDEKQIEEIFQSVDIDKSGQIHYTEFLAATMEAHGHIEEDRLAEAFDRLDCDDSGYITRENLKEILGTEYTKQKADEFIAEADGDKNGKICWDEFKTMFERRHQMEMKDFMGDAKSTMEAESDRNLLGVDADIPKD